MHCVPYGRFKAMAVSPLAAGRLPDPDIALVYANPAQMILLVNGLLAALGEAGNLAPQAAAWTAPIGFIVIGLVFVFRLDRH